MFSARCATESSQDHTGISYELGTNHPSKETKQVSTSYYAVASFQICISWIAKSEAVSAALQSGPGATPGGE